MREKMKYIQLIVLVLIMTFIFSCSGEESYKWESEKSETYGCNDTIKLKDLYHTLSELIDIDNIDSVRMSNINGTFFLSQPQLKKFMKEISTMELEKKFSVKVGSINIDIYIENRSYLLTGSSNGELARLSNNYSDYYLKLNGINFNN